ncbi:MAG: D-alanyl-D-alanine carboxypeptidase, partial [Desulfurivibrionaceae bacterium]|nr:D-alanyl-D-alanine carboxypeptidase [Desulfurivibrionaceae bacterium]
LGAESYGYPATWEKGRKAIREFIEKDPQLAAAAITVTEGSGISRENRLTVRAMLRILELFKPHARLLPEKDGVLLKSGTLTGVYSYAGYLDNHGKPAGFAIILNQNRNTRDEILKILRDIAESTDRTVRSEGLGVRSEEKNRDEKPFPFPPHSLTSHCR